jgi:HemK-like putative methylase
MPRLPPVLFRHANRLSPQLATLLPACKDIGSALNELRWIEDHVQASTRQDKKRHVIELCERRGRGEPLQYVLGSQPFGSLDIKCRAGVLIPRPETEAYTIHLADLLASRKLFSPQSYLQSKTLNVIDFCTGTGCIPLLLFASLQRVFQELKVVGVDISPDALQLAADNATYNSLNTPAGSQAITFKHVDVFSDKDIHALAQTNWDVMISNPPYVSKDVWNCGYGQLGYSVRKYEPKLALVPGDHLAAVPGVRAEDVFYARLLDVAQVLSPRALLLEVGDEQQALRVLRLCGRHPSAGNSHIELWRDWPDGVAGPDERTHVEIHNGGNGGDVNVSVAVRGSGNIRSVLLKRE